MIKSLTERIAQQRIKIAATTARIKQLLAREDFQRFDADGYPSEEARWIIENWTYELPTIELFDFIRSLWYLRSFGWHEFTNENGKQEYNLSTAGWSGNESIIHALEKNWLVWDTTWEQSRRGGHYIFEVDKDE